MATDVTDAPLGRDPAPAPAATARNVRRGWLLLGAFGWNTYVWVTRIYNLLSGGELQTRSTGFVVVHLVLYGVSLAVGLVVGVIGWRLRREALAARERGTDGAERGSGR